MTWKVVTEPRDVAGVLVSTIRSDLHNESGHEFTVGAATYRVLPDGVTTARRRSNAISAAIRGTVWSPEWVVGALILAGCRRIELDGEPLIEPASETRVQWMVELNDDGTVNARHVGNGRT